MPIPLDHDRKTVHNRPGNAPDTVIVLDFETTGHSPVQGDRPIEVGAVRIEGSMIVDRFQSLMQPNVVISRFIETLTGISNEMVADAPPCEEVMTRFAGWIGDCPLVAHNARFDRTFLDAEMARLGLVRANPMACTVLASRRLVPDAPNHKLATLVRHLGIYSDGTFHRALADAVMTAHLWIAMTDQLCDRCGVRYVPFALMEKLCSLSRAGADRYLRSLTGSTSLVRKVEG